MKLLIDGDIVLYRCAYATEKTMYCISRKLGPNKAEVIHSFPYKSELDDWLKANEMDEDNLETHGYILTPQLQVEPVENAFHNINTLINQIKADLEMITLKNADNMEIYLTGKGNFRYDVAKTLPYKGNRDKHAKPVHYNEARQFLVNQYDAIVVDGIEADDALAIRSAEVLDSVIVTTDKDLRQIPCTIYNWVNMSYQVIDMDTAAYNFWFQVLMGDKSDNIPGIPGVGETKAAKILAKVDPIDREDVVKQEYEKHYGEEWEIKFKEMCQLVGILMSRDEIPEHVKAVVNLP